MLSKSMRSGDHHSMNKIIGSNLRFIRKLKKMSLMDQPPTKRKNLIFFKLLLMGNLKCKNLKKF